MGPAARKVLEWVFCAFLPAKGPSRGSRADKALPCLPPAMTPRDHPPRRARAGGHPPRQPLNLPRTNKACLGGAAPGEGARAGLAGGKCQDRVARRRALEEQCESRGERAALPSHQPPSARLGSLSLPFAPLSSCSPGPASERGKSQHNSWSISLPDDLRTQHLLDMGWTLDLNSAFTPPSLGHKKFGCFSGS